MKNTSNIRFRSNRVRDILALFHDELDALYGAAEVSVFGEMLFEAFLGWDKVRLLTSKEQTINQSDLLRFHWALEDLNHHRPIQHIIGHVDFCGCRINVSPDVLIPRPETEEMVKYIVGAYSRILPQVKDVRVGTSLLDLCTGSGCISIALKKAFPSAEVTAVDVSPAALEMAQQNAKNNGVEVHWVEGDVLRWNPSGVHGGTPLRYDLVVSNPPYVMEKERAQMQRNVLDYDPALALFVPDDDPLRFYKAIADIAKEHLSDDGLLVVEINEALAEETAMLFRDRGLNPVIHDDFRGHHRWISATFQNNIQ